jgi:hypothetical protein
MNPGKYLGDQFLVVLLHVLTFMLYSFHERPGPAR